jgi:membrane protein
MKLPLNLIHFPWKNTAIAMRQRFVRDQLALTASSLTFTTIIALVPLLTVVLAVFTVFPMFSTLQAVLQKWLVESLVPDNIARQVMSYLTQFSGKASKLGTVGVAFLLGTALALILTIDRTLNNIWRVQKRRPLRQRVLIYWAVLTLGPLLLAVSLAMTSYVISSSNGLVGGLPGGVRWLFALLEFALLAAGVAALFRFVPNTFVRWPHAWVGGVFVSGGFEIAKKILTAYLSAMPTYSVVYGAFATVPILLVWIYVAWLIVLFGAEIAAWLPSIIAGVARRPTPHGWHFHLAIETLQLLNAAKGMTKTQLAAAMRVDATELDTVLATLAGLDWVAQLDETNPALEARCVLLVNPDQTLLAPLVEQLLLPKGLATEKIWANGLTPASSLRSVL